MNIKIPNEKLIYIQLIKGIFSEIYFKKEYERKIPDTLNQLLNILEAKQNKIIKDNLWILKDSKEEDYNIYCNFSTNSREISQKERKIFSKIIKDLIV
ncbi:MAG: hypothetical protein JXA99_01130 [Candidatus Lokiarchaeota archaeon]|nr:hypothetical protein [Candidatus Lokiarchaeota archaeon]